MLKAEAYATLIQDRELFEAELNYVINTPADIVPELEAENNFEQEKARRLLADADRFFR